jgi:hypothetical protein
MKKTRLRNSYFLIPGRDIVKKFLAFFQFTEADACTLLSVYGVHALEVDRLQNNRSNEPDQSLKDSPLPADLDTALVETAQGSVFDWPESLPVERVRAGIADIDHHNIQAWTFLSGNRKTAHPGKRLPVPGGRQEPPSP